MASRTCEEVYVKHLTILCLPREVLEKIFSYLTYDETSFVRTVRIFFFRFVFMRDILKNNNLYVLTVLHFTVCDPSISRNITLNVC